MKYEKICLKCNRTGLKQYTRGYCANCYRLLRLSGELKLIEKLIPPIKLTLFQEEVLIGLLLGDGCLFAKNDKQNAYLSVVRKIEDIEYNKYCFNIFKEFCNFGVKEKSTFDKRTNKTYFSCKFQTRLLEIFNSYRYKWYPNRIKIIPKDLILTPTIMAIWFCDDGCIRTHSKNNSPWRMEIKLSTHGFSRSDVEFLVKLLTEKLNEKFYICEDNGRFYIGGSDNATRAFIKEIDLVFPESMRRKRYWDKPEARYYNNQPKRSSIYKERK